MRPGPIVALSIAMLGGLGGCARASSSGTGSQTSSVAPPTVAAPLASAQVAPSGEPSVPDGVPDDEPSNADSTSRKNSGVVAACAKATQQLGDWAPTRAEALEIIGVASNSCYGAGSIVRQFDACARMQGTGAVKLTIGRSHEDTDCAVELRAATWQGRRFVVVDATNRDRGTVYSVNHVVERTKQGYRLYFAGFNGVPGETDVADGGEGASPEMRIEWATLPTELKVFFDGRVPYEPTPWP